MPDKKEKHVSGATIHETGKYPGLRVWAARYERVGVDIQPGEKWKEGVGNLKLRLEEGVRKFAVVGLKGETATLGEGKGKGVGEFSEKFWEEFLDNADEDDA